MSSSGNPPSSEESAAIAPFPFRRYLLFALVVIGCLVVGVLSASRDQLIAYGGEMARRTLAEHQIYLSYDRIEREGMGLRLDRVAVTMPRYQVAEQLDSTTISLNLWDLVSLQPTVTLTGAALEGTFTVAGAPLRDGVQIRGVEVNGVALKSSTTLAPLGLSGGTVAGKLTYRPAGDSECVESSEACRVISLSIDQIEKGSSSELTLPPALKGMLSLPGLPLGSSVILPSFPRTTASAALVVSPRSTTIRSASLRSTGVDISVSGKLPLGSDGVAATGWGTGVELSGTVTLERSLAAVASLVLNGQWVQGKVISGEPTSFSLTGGLIRPKLVIKG